MHLSDRQQALYNAAVGEFGAVGVADGHKAHFDGFHEDEGLLYYWFKVGDINHIICERFAERILIPVCSGCGKIRDKQGNWHKTLGVPRNQENATHTVCGECIEKHYPEYAEKLRERAVAS